MTADYILPLFFSGVLVLSLMVALAVFCAFFWPLVYRLFDVADDFWAKVFRG